MALPVSERDFQSTVIEAARLVGWTVAHFRPARTKHGWRTPVAADGAGWPDLVLCRPPRLVVVELKAEGGKLSPEQSAWLARLELCGVESHVWRPSDWDELVEVLQRRPA